MNNRLKAIGIFILTIIILAVGLTVISSLKPIDDNTPPETIPVPTKIPTPTQRPRTSPILFQLTPSVSPFLGDSLSAKSNIIEQMPFQTDDFLIEYLYTSDRFIITIKESPFEENAKKAEQWLKNQGITNLSELDITYNQYRWVE
jgi:hypothetical protein